MTTNKIIDTRPVVYISYNNMINKNGIDIE